MTEALQMKMAVPQARPRRAPVVEPQVADRAAVRVVQAVALLRAVARVRVVAVDSDSPV